MIEKKFRAYDKQYKLMGEVVELGLRKGSKTCMLYDGGQTYGNTENYEIMQFTGLKDKNGKEIYEGDLIKYKGNSRIWEVYYDENKLQYRIRCTGNVSGMTTDYSLEGLTIAVV